jgi:integrase
MGKASRRLYGTGSCSQIADRKWLLRYRPKWSQKRLSKTISAETKKAALKTLSDWVAELDAQSGPHIEVSIAQIIDLHLSDMRLHARDPYSITRVELRAKKHLIPYFKDTDFAAPLPKRVFEQYAEFRLKEGAKRATINRELAALRRALQLAVDHGILKHPIPKLRKLPEHNTRTGFVDDETYYAILRELPDHQKALWCFAYRLGIRKGELLKIKIDWVLPYWQTDEPYIKIPGFDTDGRRITKSGRPHTIPLYHPELRYFTERLLVSADPACPYLFQYRGKPLRNIRTGFEEACRRAGHPDVIFHDTRRSAIKRMEDAGIPRREAMQISGHVTESVYKRYDIGSEAGAMQAGMRLREYESRKAKLGKQFGNDPLSSRPVKAN